MGSVIPPVSELREKLRTLFSERGGVRVDDVKGIQDSDVANAFIRMVELYGKDIPGEEARNKAKLEIGKMSTQLWQEIYDTADPEFKKIMEESNFQPCREPRKTDRTLHDGYRIDLIYKVASPVSKAESMKAAYEELGYKNCKILTPDEVQALDPSLAYFCATHSETDPESKERRWKKDAVAIWRPGGCIDTQVFLPKLYDYLKRRMGQYINAQGKVKDCFRLKFDREVESVVFQAEPTATLVPSLGAPMTEVADLSHVKLPSPTPKEPEKKPQPSSKMIINGLRFARNTTPKKNKYEYKNSSYVFCPGEAVGTLTKFGLAEPAYAGFAGASIKLKIPLSPENLAKYANFNHCMEVCQEGVVLAWQVRVVDGVLCAGLAGTKSFYGDQIPLKDQEFAKNRNLLQLQMLNDVLPDVVSLALGRDTKGQTLTETDLTQLELRKILVRWVGRRSVAGDGFWTTDFARLIFGSTEKEIKIERKENETKIDNAIVLSHFGSGGCSYGPGGAALGRALFGKKVSPLVTPELVDKALRMGISTR